MIPDFLKRMLGCYEQKKLDVIDHGDPDYAWPPRMFRTPVDAYFPRGMTLPAGAYENVGTAGVNADRVDAGTNRQVLTQIMPAYEWEQLRLNAMLAEDFD